METPRTPPVVLESKPLEISEEFESRRLIEEKILAALKDDSTSTIGIFGACGIGKTRMARRIGEKVKIEKLFKVVMMVRVGPSSNMKKIAYEISDYLSVRFEGGDFVARANELLSELIMQERVLIILDDVREFLDLERIGIPLQKHNGSFKIMITSRFRKVCLAMECNVIFEVQGLTEKDIRILFSEKFGISTGSSVLQSLARFAACDDKVFPFAPTVVGRILKGETKLWPLILTEYPAMPYGSTLKPPFFAGASSSHKRKDMVVTEDYKLPNGLLKLIRAIVREVTHKVFAHLDVYNFDKPSFVKSNYSGPRLILTSKSNSKNHHIFSGIEYLSTTLQVLDFTDADIQVLPGEMKKMTNLRLLNLTNCHNLRIIQSGLLSSLVRLEELYMLGSFSDWQVETEVKRGGNASINELERLPNLTALQIRIRDPSIIPKSSPIWSRLTLYVISTPEELKCRYKESLNVSFPAVNAGEYCWQFRGAMNLDLPSRTSLVDWMCVLLRSAEYLCLNGVGSKNAVDELIPDGFKLLKRLDIGHCSTMEYLVDVVPTNGLFPSLESLCLEDLPLFKDMFNSQLPVVLFRELRSLKLHRLPALLHVCRSQTQDSPFSSLRSIQISHCPKLRSLFSFSMAWNLIQLEEIRIEYCEMMEEIFSEQKHEDGKISNVIQFSKLNRLELDTLPQLTDFCKNVRIDFTQLREMCLQSLRKFRVFCPADSDLPLEGNGSNDIQVIFNEKVEFGSLKKLEISELQNVTSIWSHRTSPSLYSELEVLVVVSCDTLRHLFSHSIAKVLVRLEHLIVVDCCMMQEVIADDGEAGKPEINESLFPQLKKLELRGLPILKSFCHVMNELELPLLEDLILYDCQGMKEFSGGTLNMPVLRCVRNDFLMYRIDGVNYSVQRLFNEKHLFIHHICPLPSQYQCQELEEITEEEPIFSHSQSSSQASGGNRAANLLYGIDAKNFCSVSNQNMMTEEGVADSLESDCQELGEKKGDEDASMSHYDEAKLEVFIHTTLDDKRYLKDSILFCSVFSLDYEFTKDILVWQWIAGGLIELGEDDKMEEVCTECFDTLLGMDYIVPSSHDHIFDQINYKIGDKMATFFQKQLLEPKFRKYLDNKQSDPTKVELLSLTFKETDRVKLGFLKQYSRLQTLVIHGCYEVDHLPYDIFLELKGLKILNLSHTNIVELPSSVDNLKELRFFDMSKTPIGWLPETICCFSHLQTLKLDGCLQLEGLPQRTSKLINLRHLILDVVRQLRTMPVGIGKLSNLRTLSAFLVDEEDGHSVRQLKDMNKLRGSFRLLNLENVGTKEEATEAYLCNKVDLRKIELQWSNVHNEKNPHEEEILESLQPPVGIQELRIVFYSGRVLPSWICNPSFSELVSIILYRCRYCFSLPSLGELPSLKRLSIIENNEVMEIDSSFCRKQTNQYHVAFPKLEKLSFDSMFKLEKWSGLEKGDFPSLRRLIIEYCPKFVELPFLSRLNSLLHLEILYCPELSCSPEDQLPLTLESLMIKESPKLKDQCCDEGWSKIARVPTVYFDNQKFSPKI